MISPNVLTKISESEEIGWGIVEKDYFLTLLLEGISNNPALTGNLVFKGGTALRKAYFRHYRYSEDLDFTMIKPMKEKEVNECINEVFEYLKKSHNAEFRIKSSYVKDWFIDLKIQFNGLRGGKNVITLDLSPGELVVEKPVEGKIFNPYYGKVFVIPTYTIEEVLAEKLRSLLQRTRVRDYYDCWYILTHESNKLNLGKVKEIFIRKVNYKKLKFPGKGEFFKENKVVEAKAYYHSQLKHQINDLPLFEDMVKELQIGIEKLDL